MSRLLGLFAVVFAVLGLLTGCEPDSEYPVPVEGTTYRMGKPTFAAENEVTLHVFKDWQDCANNKVTDIDDCFPYTNRSTGEARLAFEIRDPTSQEPLYRSLSPDEIRVTHDKARQESAEIIPHEPVDSGQLFILLIDGSGSMYENDGERVKKVWQALLTPKVVSGFFPPGNNKTGVVLLRFSDRVTGLDGGPPRVLRTKGEYEGMIREHLMRRMGGYTHLYGAAKFAVTELLEMEQLNEFMMVNSAEPTIVLLTDGFNNEKASDVCGDNAARLQATLDTVREARQGTGGSLRPRIVTVGLGIRYRDKNKPEGINVRVTPANLCGVYENNAIDGKGREKGLEDFGIDHVSLQWLADAGGGTNFVKRNPKGLADVFSSAASQRYRWYEVRYQVPDPFWHRKSFEVQVKKVQGNRSVTSLYFYPSGWLDGPPPRADKGDRWSGPGSIRATFALVMPIFGLLVLLNFMGPAWFNARRALFRRAKPRKKK